MVQPCDTTQVRPDSNFDVKFSTIQFYTIDKTLNPTVGLS